jgi:arsenite methyltransferase
VDSRVRLYEQDALRQIAGETLRPGNLTLTRQLAESCVLPRGAAVLDLGCGPGATVEFLSAQSLAVGLDLSRKLLQQARRRNAALPLIHASADSLPLPDHSLDAIFGECSLSVMADVDRVLRECRRVLKPGGKLALSDLYVRDAAGLERLRRLPFVSCLQGAMTQDEIVARLRHQGFDTLLWEDHTTALKAFTAQILFAHGSLDQFWCSAFARTSACVDPAQVRQAVMQSKPGYFILIAQRSAPTKNVTADFRDEAINTENKTDG